MVETPPNILGVVDDGWMRYVTDLGNAGPDRGQGGSFLLVHDDDRGELPDGHYVLRTPTYKNWVMARAFVSDTGEGESALSWYRKNFRVHPLATGPDPDATYVPSDANTDRKYEYLFLGGHHDFMSEDALWLDARLLYHYEAIVVDPATCHRTSRPRTSGR